MKSSDVDYLDGRSRVEDGFLLPTDRGTFWVHDAEGEGIPLFLLGGFTAGHFVFDFARRHLSDFRLITWEPRGLGRSTLDPAGDQEPYGSEVWADDLAAVLDALDIDRLDLWAAGFGSYIGLAFAALHPQRVRSLITYTDVWAGDPAKLYDRIWPVYREIVAGLGTTGYGARVLANIFEVGGAPWFAEWEALNVSEVIHAETVEDTVGYGLTKADVRYLLPRITAPVLVLQGDATWDGGLVDPTTDASYRLMREQIEDLSLRVVPQANPVYLAVEHAEECARIVRDFIATCR